jgi:UDP-N-acetylmuramoyl-L-alanyl-D-glutamate--2,6-diaminopimelate ligase
VQTNFPGRYNVSNALASLSVGVALGLPVPALQAGLQGVAGVPGRLESIDMGQDFTVIVDFAHTPRALQEVLSLARRCTPGRLICVFGCAGLRDVQKRSMMGEVAARLADLTILTAEDPRTEDVTAIIAQIAAPLFRAGRVDGRDVYREPDRARAIRLAINLAESGDVVLICGKGHERSMCWGTVEYPWSDQETARQAIQERWRDRR